MKQPNRRRSDALEVSANVAAFLAVSILPRIVVRRDSRLGAFTSITKQQLPLVETIH
jgi:hypothetical protein